MGYVVSRDVVIHAQHPSSCSNGVWGKQSDSEAAPKAPLLKDYDSFTEGTGKGSFESLLEDYPREQGDLFYHPNSLELLPPSEPAIPLSIESWREQVSGHLLETDHDPEDGVIHLGIPSLQDVDAANTFGASLASDVGGGDDDVPHSPASPSVHSASTPRAVKRSRSGSPEPSRRIRPRARSKSLSSIKSLTFQILGGLTSAPPWRVNGFGHLPPFD